jgi:serine/threonine protein kinase
MMSPVQLQSSGSSGSGQRFGNYKLIKRIGQGGFADVYQAQHIYLHHYVVVKLLKASLGQKARQSFLTEARIMVSLDHPHIVRVFDFGIQDGTPHIVMQLASKGSLRHMHPEGTRLPLATILRYAQQVADALTYLHQRNLIHQDIKPENMLLDANDNVLLGDFGLAIMLDETMSQQSEDFVATLAYTAPERFKSRSASSAASDQYALAIVIYEWLIGQRPFHGSAVDIMQQHLHTNPPPLRRFVSTIPPQVERVVLKALHKDPEQRFTGVQAFVDALRKADESSHHLYKKPELVSSNTSSNARIRAEHELALALIADLLIAVLIGAVAYLLRMGIDKAWILFTFCTFVVPIVKAFIRKKRLEKIVAVATLLISGTCGIILHNFFQAAMIQLALLTFSPLLVWLYSLILKEPRR